MDQYSCIFGNKAAAIRECGLVNAIRTERKVATKQFGRSAWLKMQAFKSLIDIYGREMSETLTKVRDPEEVVAFLRPAYINEEREVFKLIMLNTKNGVIGVSDIAIGSLNAALVHPREVWKEAIRHSAAGIILVHNHPTGNPQPSEEDIQLTHRFCKCGEILGIELVDHIIIGSDRHISLRERGVIV